MTTTKNQFLATLAHELRNPLAPITMGASVLARVKSDPDRVEHYAELIGRQARHMSALVDDLTDLSRISRGQFSMENKPVAIGEVARQALEQVKPQADAKQQSLLAQVQQPTAQVRGDQRRLVQVLVNLLQNAVKFTPTGGRIDLQVTCDAGEIHLLVKDKGKGMDESVLESAFELFKQGKTDSGSTEGGFGIGLALVKSLVEAHGGRVTAASAGPGLGSELEVVLPRIQGDGLETG